jgi:monoamine oxidase
MKSSDNSIVIIGAGIAGLIAARELLKAGKEVVILEALNRTGGRIHTISDPSFVLPVELGAEFIHGKLSHTFRLVEEYKLNYTKVKGAFFTARNGELKKSYDVIEDAGAFEKKLKAQEKDLSVNDFLELHFSEEKYNELKNSVRKFVEGYDAADADKASVLALKKEWLNENWQQFRITGGYKQLSDALVKDVTRRGGKIRLSAPVKEIHWGDHSVSVKTHGGKIYYSAKAIITVPLGVLKTEGESHIQFFPDLNEKFSTLEHLGFGPVIKVILQFREAFWRKNEAHEDIGFIFSDQVIPTWWTQLPDPAPILTGWLGGPPVFHLSTCSEADILEKAIGSLATIFGMNNSEISSLLLESVVINWSTQPFFRGAYAYTAVNDGPFILKLTEPVDDTLYFSGEGYHEGDNTGTVEAAIASAFKTVKIIQKE